MYRFLRNVLAVVAIVIPQTSAAIYTQTISSGPGIGVNYLRPFSVSFTFTGLPTITGDGLLTVTGTGDIGGINEYIRVDAFDGVALGFVFGDNVTGLEPVTLMDSLVIPQLALAAAIQSDLLSLTFVVENSFPTAYATFDSLTFETAAPIPEPSTFPLMLMGLALLGIAARKSARRQVCGPG